MARLQYRGADRNRVRGRPQRGGEVLHFLYFTILHGERGVEREDWSGRAYRGRGGVRE